MLATRKFIDGHLESSQEARQGNTYIFGVSHGLCVFLEGAFRDSIEKRRMKLVGADEVVRKDSRWFGCLGEFL